MLGPPPAALAKLVASRGQVPFDVMEITGSVLKQVVEGDFLEKIDLSKIPNTKYLNPDQFDDHKVASWTTQEAIIYNKDKFEELGIPAPAKYSDLASPKLANHVSLPDITSGGGVPGLAGFILEAGGDETNVDPGLDVVKNVKVLNYWVNGDDVLAQFKSGDIWAAAMNVAYAKLAIEAGVPVAVSHVQIGDRRGMKKQGYLGVIKGTKVADAAAFYINAYLATETQYAFFADSGELPVNQEALTRVQAYYEKEAPQLKGLYILDSEGSAKLNAMDMSKVDLAVWTDKWNRMVASR